jgi:hypothetical protein
MKEKRTAFTHIDTVVLSIIIVIGFLFRLYKFDIPLAEYYSWRQVESANIGTIALQENSVITTIAGTKRTEPYFVEFPLYNSIFAFLDQVTPFFNLTIWGRLVSAFFSLAIIGVLYYLCLKEASRAVAIGAALFYAIFPFSVFFSRTILPETPALALVFMGIWFFYLYVRSSNVFLRGVLYVLSIIMITLGILTKPTVAIYCLPLIVLFFRKYEISFVQKPLFYMYWLAIFIPFIIWMYLLGFPLPSTSNTSLFNNIATPEGKENIFLSPLYFKTVFFQRINDTILGGFMSFMLLIGIISKQKKVFLHSFGISALLSLAVFQGAHIQNAYYQLLILPAIAIFVGLGLSTVIHQSKNWMHPALTYVTILCVTGLSWYFSYSIMKDYYTYSSDLIRIARIINTLTSADDLIVTDRSGDPTLLYLANRRGSAKTENDLNDYKEQGYRYFVTDNTERIESIKLQNSYKVVFQNDKFALFQL